LQLFQVRLVLVQLLLLRLDTARGKCGQEKTQARPYTLHPTLYTRHPTPDTLHPTPWVFSLQRKVRLMRIGHSMAHLYSLIFISLSRPVTSILRTPTHGPAAVEPATEQRSNGSCSRTPLLVGRCAPCTIRSVIQQPKKLRAKNRTGTCKKLRGGGPSDFLGPTDFCEPSDFWGARKMRG